MGKVKTKDDPIAFLSNVWKKQCRTGDFVFLCTNDSQKEKSWTDHAIKYDKDLPKKIGKLLNKYNPEKYDIYFCPLPFADNKRDKRFVKRTKLLWQDLDFADPYKFAEDLKPTIFWESSPGRYHGLWELENTKHSNSLPDIETLNRDLAYQLDADKGGWDLTQVLRIPGTHNHKYPEKPLVELRKSKKKPYSFETLRAKVKRQPVELGQQKMAQLTEGNAREIIAKWKSRMPRTILTTLMQKTAPVGERSETIWHLESSLYELGLSPDEIFTLIKNSAWNKYRGRHDENERLQTELEKITSKAIQQPDLDVTIKEGKEFEHDGMTLNVETFQEVMGKLSSQPGWLVEGFWARRSHGIIAGEPKTFKSTYAMDLAISVASGKDFLGKYTVNEKGPVIYVQNENADWIIKDRMEKIINHRELVGEVKKFGSGNTINITFPQDLPLYFINQQNYMLNDPIHQEILEELIMEVKPVLIIFDPLYLMFEGDLNSAKDLSPVLSYMLNLKNKYKTGVIAIHHYNKSQFSKRGGQKMLGSALLHGFTESSWYLQRKFDDEEEALPDGWENMTEEEKTLSEKDVHSKPSTIIFEREFRSAGPGRTLEITLQMAPLGEPGYDLKIDYPDSNKGGDLRANILAAFTNDMIGHTRKTFSEQAIKAVMTKSKISRNKFDEVINILAQTTEFEFSREGLKYVLNIPES